MAKSGRTRRGNTVPLKLRKIEGDAGILGFYAYGWFANTIVSVIGVCIFIWLGRKIFH